MQTCRQSGRVARVTAFGHRTPFHVPLEIRARDVVQQQVVLQVNSSPKRCAGVSRSPPCAAAASPDPRTTGPCGPSPANAQQLLQGRPPIPRLLDVQLARRFTEAGDRQNGRHGPPGHVLASGLDFALEQVVQSQHPPQAPRHPHVAEVAQTFQRMPLRRTRTSSSSWRPSRNAVDRTATVAAAGSGPCRRGVPPASPNRLPRWLQLAEIGHHPLPRTRAVR